MQSLEYDDIRKDYPEVLASLKQKFPDETLEGKPFKVEEDVERRIVYLIVGGTRFVLEREQALDLSYALSCSAKRIVKKERKLRG